MDQSYVISCCSTVDVPYAHLLERNIPYAKMHFYLDGEEHLEDLGETFDAKEFYQKMLDGVDTKTSQVNVEEFCTMFRPILESGKDLLHVTLSSGISGTYNSAAIAVDMMREEFPDRKVYVVDSLCASAGYGLFVDLLADKRDEGATIDELLAYAEAVRSNVQHWFFSMDLTFFVKGGRVSKASGFIGNMLNICPLLNVNSEGKLIVRKKLRGKKLAIKTTVATMLERTGSADYAGKCFISHSDCIDDVNEVVRQIEATFPNLAGKVMINNIGSTIGSHTGPGTVALFFVGDEREL